MALDVCEAFRFKFFDGRVQWVHDPHHSRTARAPEVRFNLNIEEGRPAAGCAIMHSAMTQSEVKTARIIFYVAAIVGAIYGLLFLSMPERALELSHDPGVPADPAWVRWSGGVLIGIALAAWLAAQKPNKQTPLVVGLALAYLLVALSLLYSIISGEYRGAQWFIWLPILINVGLFAGMVWLLIRQQGFGLQL